MKQSKSQTKKDAFSKTKRLSPGRGKASSHGPSATPGGSKTPEESSRAQFVSGTPSREQVREVTTPRVNVPRQSKRPVERSRQSRSRRS
jgi:hypothetical protein